MIFTPHYIFAKPNQLYSKFVFFLKGQFAIYKQSKIYKETKTSL